MKDQELFRDAMALHQRYCDRRDATHECVGQWRPSLVHQAENIFAAAGIRFQSLNVECQTAVLDRLEQIIQGA